MVVILKMQVFWGWVRSPPPPTTRARLGRTARQLPVVFDYGQFARSPWTAGQATCENIYSYSYNPKFWYKTFCCIVVFVCACSRERIRWYSGLLAKSAP